MIQNHIRNISIEERYGQTILNAQAGNDVVKSLLESPAPCMIAKFGSIELNCITNYLKIKKIEDSKNIGKLLNSIKLNKNVWENNVTTLIDKIAGFFPITDAMLKRFSVEYLEHIKNLDLLGVWFKFNEDNISRQYCPKATLAEALVLQPFLLDSPWTIKLKHKRVLVIHPFEESIRNQYGKRNYLFRDKDVLPEFELLTLKAIQSHASLNTQFQDWFEAYDYMCQEVSQKNFDIAIVGAGAYSLPLCSFIKQLGKKAVHLGGDTQILFGIKGKRWDQREAGRRLYNQHWVRPLASETPSSHDKVEGGCYW